MFVSDIVTGVTCVNDDDISSFIGDVGDVIVSEAT
jgi:hypothetical protein